MIFKIRKSKITWYFYVNFYIFCEMKENKKIINEIVYNYGKQNLKQ